MANNSYFPVSELDGEKNLSFEYNSSIKNQVTRGSKPQSFKSLERQKSDHQRLTGQLDSANLQINKVETLILIKIEILKLFRWWVNK